VNAVSDDDDGSSTALEPDLVFTLTPENALPLIAFLAHDSNTKENGSVLEVGRGRISKLRRQRSKGALLDTLTPGAFVHRSNAITDSQMTLNILMAPTISWSSYKLDENFRRMIQESHFP